MSGGSRFSLVTRNLIMRSRLVFLVAGLLFCLSCGCSKQQEPAKPAPKASTTVAQPVQTPSSTAEENAYDRYLREEKERKAGVVKNEPVDSKEKEVEAAETASTGTDSSQKTDEQSYEDMLKEWEKKRQEEMKKLIEKLGAPLVDDVNSLIRFHETTPLWVDPKAKTVVMVSEVCQTDAPLEMFACTYGTKEHEAILSVPTVAKNVHAALLAIGAEAGHPVRFQPKYSPATGSEIEIVVRWKDAQGKTQTANARDWVKNFHTGKWLDVNWVFGGSLLQKDEATGKSIYRAEGGDFICVSNFGSAMLDLPIESTEQNANLLFKADKDRVPPKGTPVTMILSVKKPIKPETK